MKIPVYFKSYASEVPNDGYWDYAMLKDLLSKELWNPVNGFDFEFNYNNLPFGLDVTGAVVVIPARTHFGLVEKINNDIKNLPWVLLILMGDEDGAFPTEKLKHPNMKVWLMLPHNGKKKNVTRFFPNGYPTGCREFLRTQKDGKRFGWFFSGQITHSRRHECIKGLEFAQANSGNLGILIKTEGFTQGINQKEYWTYLSRSRVAPCPSGAIVPDSFRFYEALEASCLPLADAKSPSGKVVNFWHLLFGEEELPFPLVESWVDIIGTINYHNDTYPTQANKVFAWWQKKKREMTYNLNNDIMELNGQIRDVTQEHFLRDNITVVIPTSYVKSHPDTSVIEETIKTVRQRLPESEIIVTFDGIRNEQIGGTADYQKYIEAMLWKFNHEYKNILPMVFDKHTHQIGMMREALKQIKTDLVLYVEHDAPLCEEIPFKELAEIVLAGGANLIRFHHEALILEVHKHLMLDKSPITVNGVPVVRTGQWSQRPHLALTAFYRRILFEELSYNAFGMIEDGIIGKPSQALLNRGEVGWNDWKLMIYAPERDMKRSYHLDARGKVSKFEETFKYS